LLTLFVTGCNDTSGQPIQDPSTESVDIPTLEELIEINDLENVFKDHTSVYVNIESKSPLSNYDYTEEVIYLKGDTGLIYHKRLKEDGDTSYVYTSRVGNAFYHMDGLQTVSIMNEGEDSYFDYTLDFDSTSIGKGYIETDQIVYHTYWIYEADEMFEASRNDYTLYFNKDTKLLERMDCVSYNTDHQIEFEYSSTVTYDVANVENKFDTTAYDMIMVSENLINLEIIADVGTPEQKSYSFVTTTESQVIAAFNDVTYLLYTDSDCQNLVETLDAYKGEKNLTLYAKMMEIIE
jgi:hypothetical protein